MCFPLGERAAVPQWISTPTFFGTQNIACKKFNKPSCISLLHCAMLAVFNGISFFFQILHPRCSDKRFQQQPGKRTPISNQPSNATLLKSLECKRIRQQKVDLSKQIGRKSNLMSFNVNCSLHSCNHRHQFNVIQNPHHYALLIWSFGAS